MRRGGRRRYKCRFASLTVYKDEVSIDWECEPKFEPIPGGVEFHVLLNSVPVNRGYFMVDWSVIFGVLVNKCNYGDVCTVSVCRGRVEKELCNAICDVLKRSRNVFIHVKEDFDTSYIDAVIDAFEMVASLSKGEEDLSALVRAVFSECFIPTDVIPVYTSSEEIFVLHNPEFYSTGPVLEYVKHTNIVLTTPKQLRYESITLDALEELKFKKQGFLFYLAFDREKWIRYGILEKTVEVATTLSKEDLKVVGDSIPHYLEELNEELYRWMRKVYLALRENVVVEKDVAFLNSVLHDVKLIYGLGRSGLFLEIWERLEKEIKSEW